MYPYPMQSQHIIKVNCEASANSYAMPPNSSALMLDENQPILYVATTDGTGYKSITKYNLVPYKPPEQIDLKSIAERLKVLEDKLNGESNFRNDKQTERNQQNVKKS